MMSPRPPDAVAYAASGGNEVDGAPHVRGPAHRRNRVRPARTGQLSRAADHWVATDGLGGGYFVLYDVPVLDDLAPVDPEDALDDDRFRPPAGDTVVNSDEITVGEDPVHLVVDVRGLTE
jgi:hypothetical protein